MREHDDLPYIVIERRSGGLTPFLWGALLGAGAALLLAPRSGEETQEEIRQRALRIRTAAEDRVTTARDAVTRTRDRFQDRVDNLRGAIETRAEQARTAVDAGRRAARDARSELERRVAEAKQAYGGIAGTGGDGQESRTAVAVVVRDVTVETADDQPGLG